MFTVQTDTRNSKQKSRWSFLSGPQETQDIPSVCDHLLASRPVQPRRPTRAWLFPWLLVLIVAVALLIYFARSGNASPQLWPADQARDVEAHATPAP